MMLPPKRQISPARPTKDAIFQFVRINGPCLPNDVMRKLGSDTFLIGAYLSELVKERRIKVSAMKVGGSPLYYVQGQEAKLQEFSKFLNEKDRMAFDLLRDKRVLKDRDQQPLMRVALRAIKDFAIPLEVGIGGEKEIFWKWYLLPQELIAEEIKKATAEAQPTKAMPEIKREQAALPKKPEPKKEPEFIKTIPPKPEPIKEKIEEKKEEKKEELKTKQETLVEPVEKKKAKKDGPFLEQVTSYFSENNIEIKDQNTVKKGTEADYTILVPSAVGNLTFYCKAKGKKSVSDGDLSSAYVTGESKKLPVLFVTNGKLTKRAKEMLGKEFGNVTVKEI